LTDNGFRSSRQAAADLFDAHPEAGFEDGLQVIIAGLRACFLHD
jgi:hypothetical protein